MKAFRVLVGLALGVPLLVAKGEAFLPPEGKCLHIAGQSREDFDSYVTAVCGQGAGCPPPAGAALYTNLDLDGLLGPFALAEGDPHQDLPYLLKAYPNVALQVGLYLHAAQLAEVGDGKHDARIGELARALGATQRPVYLRIGYEFDGEHHHYDPGAYKTAYRRIVGGIRKAGVANVAYVWHSIAVRPTFGRRDPLDWWPGDDCVDWVGISFFLVDEVPGLAPDRQRLVEIAREKKLPVMICEASAVRATPAQKRLQGEAYWDFWYKPFFTFLETTPEVRAFSIIHCDWDRLSVSRALQWGPCLLDRDPVVLERWRKEMRRGKFVP